MFVSSLRVRQNIHSAVQVRFCSEIDTLTTQCTEYTTESIESTYEFQFSYGGDECVSAVLEVYAPVFVGSIILSAFLPFALHLIILPRLVPILRRSSNRAAGIMLRLFGMISSLSVVTREVDSMSEERRDIAGRRLVRQAFQALLTNAAIASTFGLAVPMVGLSSLIGSLACAVHYSHLIEVCLSDQAKKLEYASGGDTHLLFSGCTRVPGVCGITIAISSILFWTFAVYDYLVIKNFVLGGLVSLVFTVILAAAMHLVESRYFPPSTSAATNQNS